MNREAFCEFIKEFNAVHVETVDEYDAVIRLCRDCGFQIGFDVSSWRDKDLYIRLGSSEGHRHEIHTGRRFRGETYSIAYHELDVFLSTVYACDDIDVSELPDVNELLF